LFCGTGNSPDARIHNTMQVCVEKASSAPPIIQKMLKIQLGERVSGKREPEGKR